MKYLPTHSTQPSYAFFLLHLTLQLHPTTVSSIYCTYQSEVFYGYHFSQSHHGCWFAHFLHWLHHHCPWLPHDVTPTHLATSCSRTPSRKASTSCQQVSQTDPLTLVAPVPPLPVPGTLTPSTHVTTPFLSPVQFNPIPSSNYPYSHITQKCLSSYEALKSTFTVFPLLCKALSLCQAVWCYINEQQFVWAPAPCKNCLFSTKNKSNYHLCDWLYSGSGGNMFHQLPLYSSARLLPPFLRWPRDTPPWQSASQLLVGLDQVHTFPVSSNIGTLPFLCCKELAHQVCTKVASGAALKVNVIELFPW